MRSRPPPRSVKTISIRTGDCRTRPGALDLDDVGAEIGEQLAGPRTCQNPGKLQHAQTSQRTRHETTPRQRHGEVPRGVLSGAVARICAGGVMQCERSVGGRSAWKDKPPRDRGGGLDRMDSVLFALMILSRTARSAAAFGGLRSLTRSPTRTECCPCDQGRFLGHLTYILTRAWRQAP